MTWRSVRSTADIRMAALGARQISTARGIPVAAAASTFGDA
jgi:hypothetical protein